MVDKLATTCTASIGGTSSSSVDPPTRTAAGQPVADLVKRVIGLPGETISLTKGSKGYVLINGKRLDETWLPSSVQGMTFPGPAGKPYNLAKPYVIPANHYFVMGDNRSDSCDSRYWGPIARSLIVGQGRHAGLAPQRLALLLEGGFRRTRMGRLPWPCTVLRPGLVRSSAQYDRETFS